MLVRAAGAWWLTLVLASCGAAQDQSSHDDEDSGDDSTPTGDTTDSETGDTSGDTEGETSDDTENPPALCDGDACDVFDECCDGQECTAGTCQPQTCIHEDQPCDDDLPCCGEFECDDESGTCQYPPWCVGDGETCDAFFTPCCEPYVCNKVGFIDQCDLP